MRVAKMILLGAFLYTGSAFAAAGGDIPTTNVWVNIKPVFGDQPLVLGSQKYVNQNGDTLSIDLFRVYLSGFELVFADGTIYREENSYHLLDAEEPASMMINLTGIPQGIITSIKFNVGVDSVKSVSGAYGGDLDPSYGMYWAWNSGYIHAKIEGTSNKCKTYHNAFEFHIGGFSYPENAMRRIELAVTGNLPVQSLSMISISADLLEWFKGISLEKESAIVMPGKKSMQMADNYTTMFKQATCHEN